MDEREGVPTFDLPPPTESRADLAMQARIATRLDLESEDGGAGPQRIGRYEVLRRIGAGGMGVVYAALDPELDRKVAIKLLRAELSREPSEGHERLLREARALAKLSHPNVVQIHEVSEHDDFSFVVMELIAGQTLVEWQRTKSPALRELLAAYGQAGTGLAAAHGVGIVHRDFKPSNVLIGDDGRVRVVDFGLARVGVEGPQTPSTVTSEGSPATAENAGTPGYIAPEILAGGRSGPKSDQFSFCVALWEAVCGERPRVDSRAHSARESVDARFPGPAWLRRVLLRGLAANPADRWPDLPTLVRALDRRSRRQIWLALGLPIVGLVAGLALEPVLLAPNDPCAGGTRDFDAIWNDEVAAQLGSNLSSAGRTHEEALLVVGVLDRQRVRWLDTQHRVCEATRVDHSWSDSLVEQATRCLADNLQQSRDLLGLLDPAGGESPARIRSLVAALDDPRGCGDLDALARRGSPEPGGRSVDELRHSVARARLMLAGETRRVDAESEALLARARELHRDNPNVMVVGRTLGEALELRGAVEQWRQRPDLAWPLLRKAVPLARHAGDYSLELRSLHRMASIAAEQLEQPERASDFVSLAAGVVTLVEPHARASFDHALAEAALVRSEQRPGDAESILHEAIDTVLGKDIVDGPSLDRARLELANVVAEQGKLDEALAIYVDLLRSIREQVGEHSVELGFVEFNIGVTLHELGDETQAELHLRRALTILERGFGRDSVRLSPTLSVLAEIELNDERVDQALRDAERAWSLQRDQLPSEHGDRGQALKIVGAAHSINNDHAAALAAYELMAEVLETDTADEQAALEHILGWTKCRLGRCSAARPHFEAARDQTSSTQVRVYAVVGLANADVADAQPELAIQRLDALAAVIDQELGEDVELRAEVNWLLARALVDAGGDRRRARECLRQAVAGYAELGVAPDIAVDLEAISKVMDDDDE